MKIVANGKEVVLEGPQTLTAFLRGRELDPRFVVVERNGEPLERARYDQVQLVEGDRLELVRAVAGG